MERRKRDFIINLNTINTQQHEPDEDVEFYLNELKKRKEKPKKRALIPLVF